MWKGGSCGNSWREERGAGSKEQGAITSDSLLPAPRSLQTKATPAAGQESLLFFCRASWLTAVRGLLTGHVTLTYRNRSWVVRIRSFARSSSWIRSSSSCGNGTCHGCRRASRSGGGSSLTRNHSSARKRRIARRRSSAHKHSSARSSSWVRSSSCGNATCRTGHRASRNGGGSSSTRNRSSVRKHSSAHRRSFVHIHSSAHNSRCRGRPAGRRTHSRFRPCQAPRRR
jgi:hypothetical protein